jgi:lysine 6-dehydrogenase
MRSVANGTLTHLEPLTETEALSVHPAFPSMEAFLTSGGLSLLPQLLEGKAWELDLKSIRHIGHCERIRALLELGFGTSEAISVGSNVLTGKEFFLELLKRRMPDFGKDTVFCKIEVEGTHQARKQLSECKIIDFFNENDNITGTMRMAGYPLSIVAQLIVGKEIATRGVVPPEKCVPLKEFLKALAQRGIGIAE